jgi:hypothetical protein
VCFFLFSWHDSYLLLQYVTIFLFVKLFLCWVPCLLEMAGSPALGNKFTPDEVSARADSRAGIKPGPVVYKAGALTISSQATPSHSLASYETHIMATDRTFGTPGTLAQVFNQLEQ